MKTTLFVAVLAFWAANGWAADSVEERYKKTCYACHAFGANGAPKTGSEQDWAPRLAKGMATLVKHAEVGFNAMPAKGLCFDCSTEELQSLIEYMSTAE
jgi:cytochrome c5